MFNHDDLTKILTGCRGTDIGIYGFFGNGLEPQTVKLITPDGLKKFKSFDDLIKFINTSESEKNKNECEKESNDIPDLFKHLYSDEDEDDQDEDDEEYVDDDGFDYDEGVEMLKYLLDSLTDMTKSLAKSSGTDNKKIKKLMKKNLKKNFIKEKLFISHTTNYLEDKIFEVEENLKEYIHNERMKMEENIKNEIRSLIREMMEENNHKCNCHVDKNPSIPTDAEKESKESKEEVKSKGKTKTPKQ